MKINNDKNVKNNLSIYFFINVSATFERLTKGTVNWKRLGTTAPEPQLFL